LSIFTYKWLISIDLLIDDHSVEVSKELKQELKRIEKRIIDNKQNNKLDSEIVFTTEIVRIYMKYTGKKLECREGWLWY